MSPVGGVSRATSLVATEPFGPCIIVQSLIGYFWRTSPSKKYTFTGQPNSEGAAQLPETLLGQDEECLSDMPRESDGWVPPWVMYVDADWHCYLRDTEYKKEPTEFNCLHVERDAQGRYHVDASRVGNRDIWGRDRGRGKRRPQDIPVASFR